MGGQINIAKSSNHEIPENGKRGYGFDGLGNAIIILEDGSTQQISAESNIVANRGVGLDADLPVTFAENDVYVTTDSFKVYTAISDTEWLSSDLSNGRFITDTTQTPKRLYQYYNSALIWLNESSGGGGATNELLLNSPSTETRSGVPTNQQGANEEFTATDQAILDELARLANASASIVANPVLIPITTTETILDFDEDAPSTDPNILDVDEVNNELNLKVAGRYTYTTSLEIENTSNNTNHSVTVRTRNSVGDVLLTSRVVDIPAKTTRTDFRAVFYDLADGDEPINVYISLEGSNNTSLILNKYETTLSIGGVVGSSSDVNVKVSDNDSTTGKLSAKSTFGDEFNSEIINPGGNESLFTTFKGVIYNALRDFSHTLVSHADADYQVTFPQKSGIVAYLDDVTGISHAPATENLPYVSMSGAWFDLAQYTIRIIDGNTEIVDINMRDQKQLVVKIESPATSLAAFTSNVFAGRAFIKEVVIENNTGAAVSATNLIADVYENGLTSTYEFPIGETRIYYKYLNNKLFAGLSEVESSGGQSEYELFDIAPTANTLPLLFDADKMSNSYVITAPIEIQKAAGAHKAGKIIQLIMTADGITANKPTFTTDHSLRSDNWDNSSGVKNVITMKYLNDTSVILIDYAKL